MAEKWLAAAGIGVALVSGGAYVFGLQHPWIVYSGWLFGFGLLLWVPLSWFRANFRLASPFQRKRTLSDDAAAVIAGAFERGAESLKASGTAGPHSQDTDSVEKESPPSILLVDPPTKMLTEQGRVFISNIHPINLLGTFSGVTDYQFQKAVEAYIGKWYALQAVVSNVSNAFVGDGFNVSVESGTFMRHIHTSFRSKFKDHLVILREGDRLKFVGKVQSIDRRAVYLEECEPI